MATIVDGDELTDKKSDERRRKGMAKLAQLWAPLDPPLLQNDLDDATHLLSYCMVQGLVYNDGSSENCQQQS
jgi:hypothetical protein